MHGPHPGCVNTVALRTESTAWHDAVEDAVQPDREALDEVLVGVQLVIAEPRQDGVQDLVNEDLHLLVLAQPLADVDQALGRDAATVLAWLDLAERDGVRDAEHAYLHRR